jgi:hypothetical protein
MSIIKLAPYILDSTLDFTFNNVTATGNIGSLNANLGNAATANYFTGNGIFISNIAGANVSGQVGNALVAGTIYTNAQPNITSVGSLSGLTVSNATGIVDFTTTANVTLGLVSNLHISGGTDGYVLKTDGSGTLSWVAQSGGGGSPGGSNTQVQFNDNGSFGGNAAFTFNKTTGNVVITGNISGLNYATANYFTGTLTTGAQPNITSIGSLSSLTVSGLITATGTGLKAANIQDSSGTITIVTGYSSVSGAVGIYGNITVGTSGTGFFIGNGSYLSGLTGGNVSGQVGNALVAGTVYTNAQPNITSVGTLTTLSSGTHTISANANIAMSGTLSQISGGNLVSATYLTGVLTASRLNPRTSSTASTATLTPDISAYDQYNITALATGLTIAAPTGTPVDGNKLLFRIIDSGSTQSLTWNATYTVVGATLPTATTASKMVYVGCIYNSTNTRWDVIAVSTQA